MRELRRGARDLNEAVPGLIAGLIGPDNCKSIRPMAARTGDVSYDQLQHFVANGVWDAAPLEAALLAEADVQGKRELWAAYYAA